MESTRTIKVVEHRVVKRQGYRPKSTITRSYAVDPDTGMTTPLGADPTRELNGLGVGTTSCSTAKIVPPGTIILQEKFTGELQRPQRVDYSLHVSDGSTFRFIDYPDECDPSSLHVVHQGLHLYFTVGPCTADVRIKRMAKKNGFTVFVDHTIGSEYEHIYGDDNDDTKREATTLARILAARGGSIVRSLSWEDTE
jgi:hypothetical protein